MAIATHRRARTQNRENNPMQSRTGPGSERAYQLSQLDGCATGTFIAGKRMKPDMTDLDTAQHRPVSELIPGRSTGVVTLRSTVFNQRKELVLEGMQKFLIRRRPPS